MRFVPLDVLGLAKIVYRLLFPDACFGIRVNELSESRLCIRSVVILTSRESVGQRLQHINDKERSDGFNHNELPKLTLKQSVQPISLSHLCRQ